MVVVYDSQTGNVERFIKKLCIKNPKLFCIPIEEYHKGLGKFHLITHTTKLGQIPKKTVDLLYKGNDYKENFVNLQSVSSSGNRNWGKNFAIAADMISMCSSLYKENKTPIFLKFELSGTVQDVNEYLKQLENYAKQMDSSQQ